MRILNMWGDGLVDDIRAAAPEADVVNIGGPESLGPDVNGEILFALWSGHPIFDQLDALGVKWMHLPGTGVDSFPRSLLEGRVVTCARGVSAIPIAEFVLASMLAFEKEFPRVWLHEPPEHWNIDSLGELAGKTVGIVGLGGIGTAVARRALGFDMRVCALRRRPGHGAIEGVELAKDLDDLVATADHLILAAPSTPSTQGMIDTDVLTRVKPGVHLVNIARGSIVDQDALRAALDDGRVARASLDTVDPEPLPDGHWLYSHPQVRLTAHISWSSPKAFDRIKASFTDNLKRYVAGTPLHGVVDSDEGY